MFLFLLHVKSGRQGGIDYRSCSCTLAPYVRFDIRRPDILQSPGVARMMIVRKTKRLVASGWLLVWLWTLRGVPENEEVEYFVYLVRSRLSLFSGLFLPRICWSRCCYVCCLLKLEAQTARALVGSTISSRDIYINDSHPFIGCPA